MADIWNAITDFFGEYEVLFRVLLIIVIAVLVNWLLRFILTRLVRSVVRGVKRAQDVDSTQELTAGPYLNARAVQRTRTLGTFGRNVITLVIGLVALFLILASFGVNLTAAITSAGFIAAGLAFGAQNVVKDVLNGLFMVFEDQLGVGDWVTIGEISGRVEEVGIRITKVRGINGTLWFVRNGEALSVGNASQGWGQALIDITVDAESDVELAERLAVEAGRELIADPEFSRRIVGQPEVWGLESVHGDRATLRVSLRTRPEAQWGVQRAWRARLQRKFRENNVRLATELPKFPGAPS